MNGTGLPLTEIASQWRTYQEGMIAALTPLSGDQLSLRPASHLWSIGMIAAHVVAVRAGWFHGWMKEGGPEFDLLPYWDDEPDPHSANEIVENLALTWRMIESALACWTPEDLEKSYTSPFRKDRPPRTRKWIAWHVIEHDIHHGGEISLILGMHGMKTLDV